ncbi:MAG: response regulator [Acidobacteriota bacterium]|nr:response regulator [Acidobacteriota bacterium]
MSFVLGVVSDLMFSVRIGDAAKRAGKRALFVGSYERAMIQAAANPSLVIVDLACEGAEPVRVIEETKKLGLPVIAFGSHVDTEALQAAKRAGADRVMARSAFVKDLAKLVG